MTRWPGKPVYRGRDLANIVTQTEAETYLAGAGCRVDAALVRLIHPMVEGKVRDVLGWWPQVETHTEYLPAGGLFPVTSPFTEDAGPDDYPFRLRLGNRYVRSVSGVWVVPGARGAAAAFSGAAPYDPAFYWFDPDGYLVSGSPWPVDQGEVKVTYQSGLTPAELASTAFAAIRMGTLEVFAAAYRRAQRGRREGGGAGAVVREKWPDFEVEFSDRGTGLGGIDVGVPPAAMTFLQKHVRYA